MRNAAEPMDSRSTIGWKRKLSFDKEEAMPPEIMKKVKKIIKGESMETGHELFVHGLNDMMDAEKQLVQALKDLSGDSSRTYLKKAFDQHRRETERQVGRLEDCFELLGEEVENTECHGIRGLVAEKKAFSVENPSDDLIDVFNVGAAIKAESYEICEYESLIDMARDMKHAKVLRLLTQNLNEEKATLKKMDGFSKKVKPEKMMSETQEEEQDNSKGGGSRRNRAA